MSQRILDSHVHWRDPVNNPYEQLSDELAKDGEVREASPAPVYLPKDYFADADTFNIVGFVHIEAEWSKLDPVGETEWLNTLGPSGATNDLPYVIVGHADLASDNVEPIFEGHTRSKRIRGIRHFLNYLEGRPEYCWAKEDHLQNPLWRNNYGLLAKYGLDFDLMCFAHQMLEFAPLAASHPTIAVHLEHCGMPWDHTPQGRDLWRKGMAAMADLPHVDLKISGFGNTITNWNVSNIRQYVLEAIELFGVDRVSFASNFPTDKQFSSMAAIWQAFFEITKDFSQSEKDAMFADNAMRTYRI